MFVSQSRAQNTSRALAGGGFKARDARLKLEPLVSPGRPAANPASTSPFLPHEPLKPFGVLCWTCVCLSALLDLGIACLYWVRNARHPSILHALPARDTALPVAARLERPLECQISRVYNCECTTKAPAGSQRRAPRSGKSWSAPPLSLRNRKELAFRTEKRPRDTRLSAGPTAKVRDGNIASHVRFMHTCAFPPSACIPAVTHTGTPSTRVVAGKSLLPFVTSYTV